MPLVPAICTQCGANLTVDASKDAAVCPFCQTAFVTEKAITVYNNTYHSHIENLHAGVVNISDSFSRDEAVKAGDTFVLLNDFDSAKKVFTELSEKYPHDYRGWWGLIKVNTKNFQPSHIPELISIRHWFRNACAVAPESERNELCKYMENYLEELENSLNTLKESLLDEKKENDYNYNHDVDANSELVRGLEAELKSIRYVSEITLKIAILVVLGISLFERSFWRILVCVVCYGFLAYLVCGVIELIFDREAKEKTELLSKQIKHAQLEGRNIETMYTAKNSEIDKKINQINNNLLLLRNCM